MGKKNKVVQTPFLTQNTFTEWKPTITPEIQALQGFQDQNQLLQPALDAQYDRAQQRGEAEINSAYNARVAPEARMGMLGNLRRNLLADKGAALAQGAYQNKDLELRRKLALAEMTMGRPLQTGSSGYNSQVIQQPGILGSVIGGAATVGAVFA